MDASNSVRLFSVHACHQSRSQAHSIRAESFESAAIGFVERWMPAPDEDDEARIVVHDPDSGAEQCFVIDLGTGDAAPC